MNGPLKHNDEVADRRKLLEDLVPIVADVIQHALTLQQRAEESTEAFRLSIQKSEQASLAMRNAAVGLDQRLAAQVVSAVSPLFDEAVGGAAHRISVDLERVKVEADLAIKELKRATSLALESVRQQSSELQKMKHMYALAGMAFGTLVSCAVIWLVK